MFTQTAVVPATRAKPLGIEIAESAPVCPREFFGVIAQLPGASAGSPTGLFWQQASTTVAHWWPSADGWR